MKEKLKKIIQNKKIMAIVSIIFGIILIVQRSAAIENVIRILGFFVLAGGVVFLLSYFFGKENKGNPSTMATAVLYIVVAIIFIYTPKWLINFFPVVMGLIVIVNSVFNISGLLNVQERTGIFGAGMVLSVISLIFGIVAVLNPTAMANFLIAFLGFTCLINGVDDLLTVKASKE